MKEVGVATGLAAGMWLAFADGKKGRRRLAELAVVGVGLAAAVVVVAVVAGEASRPNPIFCGVLGSRNQCASLFPVGFCRRFEPLLPVRDEW